MIYICIVVNTQEKNGTVEFLSMKQLRAYVNLIWRRPFKYLQKSLWKTFSHKFEWSKIVIKICIPFHTTFLLEK